MPPEEASSPAAEDTSAAGLATEAPAATSELSDDEFDAINTMAAPDDTDGEGDAPAGEGEDGKPVSAGAGDDLVEVEAADGTKVKVPAKLKDDFLRHADYTRKRQEDAEARRALDTERQTWEQQREESRAALPEEHAKVAIVSARVTEAQTDVAEFEKIDWATWRAQTGALPADDPNRIEYQRYRAAYDAARETLTDAQRELGAAKETLSTKEQTRLDEQAKGRETALATARQETGKALVSEGWDQQRFADVATFAVTELGYTPEELQDAVDPRSWRMADRLRSLTETNAKLTKALEQNKTAQTNLKAQESRPAEPAKGNAQPTRLRDENSTDAWMKTRNRQVTAKHAAPRGGRA